MWLSPQCDSCSTLFLLPILYDDSFSVIIIFVFQCDTLFSMIICWFIWVWCYISVHCSCLHLSCTVLSIRRSMWFVINRCVSYTLGFIQFGIEIGYEIGMSMSVFLARLYVICASFCVLTSHRQNCRDIRFQVWAQTNRIQSLATGIFE